MKKMKAVCFVFMLTLASNGSASGTFVSNKNPEWKHFFQQYVASIGIGAVVGVSTDIATEYFFEKMAPGVRDKSMAQAFTMFLIKSIIKSKLLQNIRKDMRRYNIPYKDSLMFWITHLTPFKGLLKDIYVYAKEHHC